MRRKVGIQSPWRQKPNLLLLGPSTLPVQTGSNRPSMKTLYYLAILAIGGVTGGIAMVLPDILGLSGLQAFLSRIPVVGVGFLIAVPVFKRYLALVMASKKQKEAQRMEERQKAIRRKAPPEQG